MNAEEAIRRIASIGDRVIGDWSDVMIEVAETAATMIKDRIIKSGINAEGVPFAPYSTKPMLVNCKSKYMTKVVCAELTSSKKKRKDLKWVTLDNKGKNVKLFELEGGYKQFRELMGRQTGFVDFAFSGRMWASVKVVSGNEEHRLGRARISTLSEEQMKKLEGNTERRGTILDLSKEEIAKLAPIIEARVTKLFKEQGF